MRPPPFHGFPAIDRGVTAAGGAPLPEGHSALALQAGAAFVESIDAFGRAATDELVRLDVDRKAAKANVVTLHRQRMAEIKRISEAFGRSCVSEDDRCFLRFALESSLATLDDLYKQFRRAVNVIHGKG
ncbi:hypothetical protein [Sinorhizobium fredii]|uniref:hypothetical protein n=1 Tax=Rhizobium fredii TaxID=380 RepID=UPI00059E225A|nr:hypothetical protein [Sinorhizobium fredii]